MCIPNKEVKLTLNYTLNKNNALNSEQCLTTSFYGIVKVFLTFHKICTRKIYCHCRYDYVHFTAEEVGHNHEEWYTTIFNTEFNKYMFNVTIMG